MLDDLCLSARKAVLLDQNITLNRQFPTLFHLGQLGDSALDKVLHPPSQVHVAFADALNRPIEGASVSVVILADRKQTLEIITSADCCL